jgi:hypothetical protein
VSHEWSVTFDAHHAPTLAAFWATALDYVPAPVPDGFASWEEWFERFADPGDVLEDVAAIVDPDGVRPRIAFLKVPEGKTAKNRVHLDVQVGGGRAADPEARWARISAKTDQLVEAGGTVATVFDNPDGRPDHVLMLDPEGNEFCVA